MIAKWKWWSMKRTYRDNWPILIVGPIVYVLGMLTAYGSGVDFTTGKASAIGTMILGFMLFTLGGLGFITVRDFLRRTFRKDKFHV